MPQFVTIRRTHSKSCPKCDEAWRMASDRLVAEPGLASTVGLLGQGTDLHNVFLGRDNRAARLEMTP